MSVDAAIIQQLADGKFHSGAQLALAAHVSRTAIWKRIARLADVGLQVDAVKGRGYRLKHAFEPLAADTIISNSITDSVHVVPEIASTNTWLLEHCQELPAGSLCVAEYQTAGRGRNGREWNAGWGGSLLMSWYWRFSHQHQALSLMSLAAGLAVTDVLREAYSIPAKLKWPNDIWLAKQKLAGILVEARAEVGQAIHVVVGIGLNIHLPAGLERQVTQPITCLTEHLSAAAISRNMLIASVERRLRHYVACLENQDFTAITQLWRERNALQGQAITVLQSEQQIEGVMQGIDDNGALVLGLPDGSEQRFYSGEVSVRAR